MHRKNYGSGVDLWAFGPKHADKHKHNQSDSDYKNASARMCRACQTIQKQKNQTLPKMKLKSCAEKREGSPKINRKKEPNHIHQRFLFSRTGNFQKKKKDEHHFSQQFQWYETSREL